MNIRWEPHVQGASGVLGCTQTCVEQQSTSTSCSSNKSCCIRKVGNRRIHCDACAATSSFLTWKCRYTDPSAQHLAHLSPSKHPTSSTSEGGTKGPQKNLERPRFTSAGVRASTILCTARAIAS